MALILPTGLFTEESEAASAYDCPMRMRWSSWTACNPAPHRAVHRGERGSQRLWPRTRAPARQRGRHQLCAERLPARNGGACAGWGGGWGRGLRAGLPITWGCMVWIASALDGVQGRLVCNVQGLLCGVRSAAWMRLLAVLCSPSSRLWLLSTASKCPK